MIFDYSLAGSVIAGLLVYLTYALAQARAVLKGSDHDRHRLGPDSALLRNHRRDHAAARRLYDPRLQWRAHISVADPAAGGARDLQDCRRRRAPRAARRDLYGRHAAVPRRRLSHSLCADARSGGAAVQSGGAVGGRSRSLVQYGGELYHQHQLAELRRRKHDVLPRANARPDASELFVGGDRHRTRYRARFAASRGIRSAPSAISGSMSRARTLYILIPICVPYALFLVWQGMPQTLGAYVDATTLEGAKQTIAVGPVASQIAIKMLGTNGGGFFNANAAHPFENPTALSNFVQMISIFAHRCSADQRLRPHGRRPASGLGVACRHGRSVRRRRHRLLCRRSARQRCAQRARPHRRQHGRQGSPLRHRRFGTVCGHHHRRLLRCGERHARFVHRPRRHDPADQYRAWRDHRRRRRAPACTACCCSSSSPSSSPA